MKKAFPVSVAILGLALCPLQADDYVDDAYYWEDAVSVSKPESSSIESSSEVRNDAITTSVKKVPSSVRSSAPQKATASQKAVQSANRPVTSNVEFIQVKDTVVKAVIHRNNQ